MPANTTRTTLSAAIGSNASGQSTTISLTATTGMSASTNSAQTFIICEQEVMRIVSLSPFVVSRGEMGTRVSAHPSGAYVWYGLPGSFSNNTGNCSGVFLSGDSMAPFGAALRADQGSLPVFHVNGQGRARVYDINGGYWVGADCPVVPTVSAEGLTTIPIGTLALTAYGTDTVNVAATIYVASIIVPTARLVTGISGLTGTTAPTTDKQLFGLWDSGGVLIATTAAAGLEAATADIFFDQAIAVVNGAAATSVLLLPGRYFVGNQLAGGTTSMQKTAIATGYQTLLGNSRTGVFGTLPAITVPTTLVDVTAPIMALY